MTEKNLENLIFNIAENQHGFDFLCFLIDELRPLERGFNSDTNLNYYNSGRKDFGIYILNLLQKYNFQKYTELMKKRSKTNE